LELYSPFEKEEIERNKYPEFLAQFPRVIVDGHCKLYPEQIECFNHFFLIEAQPHTILERRLKRGRRVADIELIKQEIEIYRNRTLQLSDYGINFININNEKELEIAKKEIITHLN
jgi:adenylate kinase